MQKNKLLKYFIQLSGILLTIFILCACSSVSDYLSTNNSTAAVKGQMQLSFNLDGISTTKQQMHATSVDKPIGVPTYLQITIKQDNKVVVDTKYDISKNGSTYNSAIISLQPGTYLITSCAILNETNQIIYVAPTSNQYTTNPCPITTTVRDGEITSLNIAVIPVIGGDLNLGIINQAPIHLSLSILNGSQANTSAEVRVATSSTDLLPSSVNCVYNGTLDATVNSIRFRSDYPSYTINIIKNNVNLLQQTYTQTVLASDSINLLSYDFPLTAPAYPTLIADNFEDNSCADWWNGDGLNLAVVSNSPSELAALPGLGNFSLDLSSSSADTYAGYAGVYVGKPVTPAYNALQVVVYGYGANSGILTIELRDDDDHNYQFDAAADDVFTYNLNVNWKGWQIITIPFGKFQLKSGSAGDGIFNPGSENDTSAGLLQINFTTNNDQPTSRFHIKIDSLRFAAY